MMKKIEYKHIRHTWGLKGAFSKRHFHNALMAMLEEQAKDGWELRGTIYELGLHAHLIFAREVEDVQSPKT